MALKLTKIIGYSVKVIVINNYNNWSVVKEMFAHNCKSSKKRSHRQLFWKKAENTDLIYLSDAWYFRLFSRLDMKFESVGSRSERLCVL